MSWIDLLSLAGGLAVCAGVPVACFFGERARILECDAGELSGGAL